ncbi:MAG: Na/Pi cotransporter family protein [Gammaproteobacteria bacterium]|nr:Na/Pi cotransporter family protein [Gammaproteobacteria bacterium]
MNELIKSIIYLLVGVTVLLVGMRMMSNGMKKSISVKVKNFFKRTENKPFANMGIGAVITMAIQSSDASNAMVVGFIDTGALTLYQGLAIMLGAYIGTTITGIIASFSSLSISVYFLIFCFIGIVMTFFANEKIVNIGEIICGLGLLFFGLAVMKDAFKNPDITSACQTLFSSINFGPLFFLFGVIITGLIQSSSAVNSIVIAMVGSGALDLSSGLFLALGATLGTVITTVIVSLNGSVEGKRAAIIMFSLRLLTSLLMVLILTFLNQPIANAMHVFAINGSDELPIALFIVFYNLVFMPLLLPLLKPAIKIGCKVIKNKKEESMINAVHFIDDKLLSVPSVALSQVKKEIMNMFTLSKENYLDSMKKMLLNDNSFDKQIAMKESQIDYLNQKITDFLIKLSTKVSLSHEREVGAYFHVINDIERIGDHAFNFYEEKNDLDSKELFFSEAAKSELGGFNEVICEMFDETSNVFENNDISKLKKVHELEDETDNLKKILSDKHFSRIKTNACSQELTSAYLNVLTELERIGDHLTNIAYSIDNPNGDIPA